MCVLEATKKEVYRRMDRKSLGHVHQSSEHLTSGSEIPQSVLGDGNWRWCCILVSHFATQDFILSIEQYCMEKS